MKKTRWRVLIGSRSFGKAAPEHLDKLRDAGCKVVPNAKGRAYREEELMDALPGMDAIITGTDQLTRRVIEHAPSLKTIAKHGVGLETIDLDAAWEAGITITSTPGVIQDAVADLSMALMLALARRIVPAHAEVVAGHWKPFFGFELGGKTLGIVGLGQIGKAVCRRARGFGMQIVAYDPYPDFDWAAANEVTFAELDKLLATSDVVSLHAPVEATEGCLIDKVRLGLMKSSAVLINTARGQLVDEAALARALKSGALAGAGLDVFWDEPPNTSPLLGLDNVVLTPHIGGRTLQGQHRMGEMVIDNCLMALRGEPPLHPVWKD